MARVAAQLNYFLPFGQCAPTMKRAMEVLYSDHDRLLTSQGFANVLAFRGIFYGSDFVRLSQKVTTSETLISDYKVRSQVRNNVKSSLIMVYYLY